MAIVFAGSALASPIYHFNDNIRGPRTHHYRYKYSPPPRPVPPPHRYHNHRHPVPPPPPHWRYHDYPPPHPPHLRDKRKIRPGVHFYIHLSDTAKKRVHAAKHRDKLVAFVKENKYGKTTNQEAERIVNACMKTHDPLLYLSLIKTESSYYPRAVSKVGARGLGQVMYSVHHKDLKRKGIISTKEDLFNIEKNVRASEHVYSNYLEESNGSHQKALAKYLGCHSKSYIRKTLETYSHLKKITGA